MGNIGPACCAAPSPSPPSGSPWLWALVLCCAGTWGVLDGARLSHADPLYPIVPPGH